MDKRFTTEQIGKAKTCKTVEELLTLAKENDIELTEAEIKNFFAELNPESDSLSDNELESVSGGCGDGKKDMPTCPNCNRKNVFWNDTGIASPENYRKKYRCDSCGYTFD